MRPGGASALASDGAEIELIRRLGRSVSDFVLRYVRFDDCSLRRISGNLQKSHGLIRQMKMSAPEAPHVGFNQTEPYNECRGDARNEREMGKIFARWEI